MPNFCNKCGNKLSPDSLFCSNCGKQIKDNNTNENVTQIQTSFPGQFLNTNQPNNNPFNSINLNNSSQISTKPSLHQEYDEEKLLDKASEKKEKDSRGTNMVIFIILLFLGLGIVYHGDASGLGFLFCSFCFFLDGMGVGAKNKTARIRKKLEKMPLDQRHKEYRRLGLI